MSEVVNTNTAEISQPIAAGGGEAPVSWDALESVSNYRQEVAKQEAKEELSAESQAKKDLGIKDKSAVEKSEKVSKDKSDKKAEEARQEIKRLKLKHNEQDLDLPLDVAIPVKIDGKTENVSLQELQARYSQQKHLDQKYQELKKERTNFESERTKIRETLEAVNDLLVNKKDIRGFIELVAEPLGLDPSQVYQEMREKLESQFEEAQALSPEERKAKTLEEELAYYRRKQEESKQQAVKAKAQKELETHVESVLQKSGMDKAAFVKSYDELVSLGFKADELTPDQIGSYYHNLQVINRVEAKLAEKNPEVAENREEVERLMTLILQNDASDEEIDLIIEQLYSSNAERKLAKKINKSQLKAAAETKVKNPSKDPLFFDDI